ncbi:MAG: hypothetical protein GF307_13025 [candidate division Zixibacteria bacterium]|nr:hypothetical protein [candidate division Zixibacteria bacterium]
MRLCGIKKVLWQILLAMPLIIGSCAKSVPPPGGPEDKTPPEIVSVFPENGAVNIPVDTEIKIEFSESMTKTKFTDDIFISPILEGDPKYEWKGATFIIKPDYDLNEDRTYVLVIGTNIADLRGNRLEYPYSLAFSTGETLDRGAIRGKAYVGDKIVKGLGIWIYELGDTTVPDPVNDPPQYATQAGEDGTYNLMYLAPSKYRIFAINDKNRDMLWDCGDEEFATAPYDLVLGDSLNEYSRVNMVAADFDTASPYIDKCTFHPGGRLEVKFDINMDSKSVTNLENFEFVSEQGGQCPFNPLSAYILPVDPQSVFIKGEITGEESACSLFVSGVKSKYGVENDTVGNSCLFLTKGETDTLAPSVIKTVPPNGNQNFPKNATILVHFNEPMMIDSVNAAFSLVDSLESAVEGTIDWQDSITMLYKPDSLAGAMAYEIRLQPERVFDVSLNSMKDSVWASKFITMPDDTGGVVMGEVSSDAAKPIGLVFRPLGRGESIVHILDRPGNFSLPGIPGGKYLISAFIDRDGDSTHFTGGYRPFRYSEPVVFYPDTVVVRPRWETDGIMIKFNN